jgi:YD repeat-containing protein
MMKTRVNSWVAACVVRPESNAVTRAWSASLVLSAALLPMAAQASPSDCMGTSPDGKAKCTAPILSGYTYYACNISQLYIGLGRQAQCDWSALGVVSYPDTDAGGWDPGASMTTDPAAMNNFITCMGGTAPPKWAVLGESVGTYWCPEDPVRFKFGVEVHGVSEGIPDQYSGLVLQRDKVASCPAGTMPVGSGNGMPDYCVQVPKCNCEKTHDPMGIVNGDQSLDEMDIAPYAGSPLEFSRSYSSTAYYRPVSGAKPSGAAYLSDSQFNGDWDLIPGFGDYWRHTYSSMVLPENQPFMMATVLRPNGVAKHFAPDGTSILNEDGEAATLTATRDANNAVTGWLYRGDDRFEKYSATGQLTAIQTQGGRTVSLTYYPSGVDAGLLQLATDDVGRTLTFNYDAQYQLSSIVDVAGNTTSYGYTGQMLSSVTYPDTPPRTYLYHENPIGANGDLFGMTGIVDELGNRYATYGYETAATPAYTELAGGVDHTVRTVVDANHVSITDPMGAVQTYATAMVSGVNRSTGSVQPAGSGNAASASSHTFDIAGNVASVDNPNGERTCLLNDPVRLVETVRVEGLPATQSCDAVEAVGAVLPAGSRKVSTIWHPKWHSVARLAEPLKITTYVYNGQPDPTAGGAIVSCAPATALLFDGSPLGVLCRKVEVATTDANGAAGFSAVAQSGVVPRVSSWTYNALGQVLTATSPRGYPATYTYYPSTSFTGTGMNASGHTVGDLQSLKDPGGLTTSYTAYNLYGAPLTIVDANGVTTTNVYDSRRRLKSTTVGTDLTALTYDAAGQVKTMTMPNGVVITYTYDAAHRLTNVADSGGNTIAYTLDGAGNRLGEQVKDPDGALARNVSRSFDILGRVQSVTGAAQ